MYQEKDNEVILTLSREDYSSLLLALGIAYGWAVKENLDITPHLELINRINQGNPDFTPYEIGVKK